MASGDEVGTVGSLMSTFHKDPMGPAPIFARNIFYNLADQLEERETPVALVGGKQSMRVVALLLTDRRLLVMHPSRSVEPYEYSLDDVCVYWSRGAFGGQSLVVEGSDDNLVLSKPLPAPEVHRMCALLAPQDSDNDDRGEALREGDLDDPGLIPYSVFEGIAGTFT